MVDWDAARYHRISDPQVAWGRLVASWLDAQAGERILDIGCGTGRLTAEIAETPGIVVVGLDRSAAMLLEARQQRGSRVPSYVQGDGAALPFANAFDAVFSAATFHWIADHDRLFQSIHTALKDGGRIVAQCGGAGNLDMLYGRAGALMDAPAYRSFYGAWKNPTVFEAAADTERRLARAGFTDLDVAIVPAPVRFDGPDSFSEFIACVCLRHQLDRLPGERRDGFIDALTGQAAADDPPFTLDYMRLNIRARKAGG